MKKVLYGTTALVSAGVMAAAPANAADKIKLGLGGYYNTFFSVGDVDSADTTEYVATNVYSEGEVHFKGSTTLDNGLEIGFQSQLELNVDTSDIIDESYIFIEGAFGRFLIGSENSASYLMGLTAPEVGAPVNSGWVTVFIPPAPGSSGGVFRGTHGSTKVDFANDGNKISYFTPRISGFQVGVSFAPDATTDGENNNLAVEDAAAENGVSAGINYVGNFGSSSVKASAVYATRDEVNDADFDMYGFGLNVGFGPVSLGASYSAEESDGATDGEAYDIGVSYATGPWTVGVYGLMGSVEGSLADTSEDELTAAKGAVSYSLAPGITASATVMYAEWEVEDTEGDDQDGLVGIVGISLGF